MTLFARYRILLPVLSLAILLAATFYMQPRAMSYFGVNLLFNLAVPIALAEKRVTNIHGGRHLLILGKLDKSTM